MFPFEYLIVKPISEVKFPLCTTTIWVVTLLFIVIWKESLDAPYVKLDPNVATTTLFCLNPKIFPPQPFPLRELIVIMRAVCPVGMGVGLGLGGLGPGVGVGEGGLTLFVKLTFMTLASTCRLQSCFLSIYPNP